MIERPYRVELGDHKATVVRRDAEFEEACRVAWRISTENHSIQVHVKHRDIGIVRSYETGMCIRGR